MKPAATTPAKVGIVLLLVIAVIAVTQMKPGKPASGGSASPTVTGVPRMLELGSVSCIPCKMMQPVMEELEQEYGPNLKVDFIDVWQNPEEGRRYGIESIPTQILYDANGKELMRHVGFWPKEEIVAAFAQHGVKLKKR